MTVTKIDPVDLSLLQREMNKSLMVAWINADLLNRAGHDVRKSIALYDDEKMFVGAATEEQWAINAIQDIAASNGVCYWSKGVV